MTGKPCTAERSELIVACTGLPEYDKHFSGAGYSTWWEKRMASSSTATSWEESIMNSLSSIDRLL
eukprot:2432296-Rhodomonas_salina.3